LFPLSDHGSGALFRSSSVHFNRSREPTIGLLRRRSSDGTCGPPARKIHYHDIIVNNVIENFVVKKTERRVLPFRRRTEALSEHEETRRQNGVSGASGRIGKRPNLSEEQCDQEGIDGNSSTVAKRGALSPAILN
jgi:hypothetical protein